MFRDLVVCLLSCAACAQADDLSARVVVLANTNDPESLRIARHYADARHVPARNIIALPMPMAETISWTEFLGSIWTPLQQELVRHGWLDAIPMNLVDSIGRRKVAMSGHRISYLVTCRGVPLRIAHASEWYTPTLPFTHNPQFRTNAGAVDSELSLLATPNYPINAFAPNPLHRDEAPSRYELAQVIKVSRLDGPTPDDAMSLVNRALAAEATGLLGRAYVDMGGIHPDGDRWLESAVRLLREAGVDTQVDQARTAFSSMVRFDAPVFYFGWYARSVSGPFTLPGFRFPSGAIAVHIHSASAETVRSAGSNWCGPLIAVGVTATVGNVFEPYLQLTHRPDLLLRALLRGDNWGDATCYAQPALSWQTIALGDPLYRPFAAHAPSGDAAAAASELWPYGVVREMIRLELAKKATEALAVGRHSQGERPNWIVALALAERLHAAGDSAGAAAALATTPIPRELQATEWAVAQTVARLFVEVERPAPAVAIYRQLLTTPALPAALKADWLPAAIEAAMRAGEERQVQAWRRELGNLPARPAQ